MQSTRSYCLHSYNINNNHGLTLVELLVASLVTSIVALGTAMLLYFNWHQNQLIGNKSGTSILSMLALRHMGTTVREARNIADSLGILGNPGDPGNGFSFPAANEPFYTNANTGSWWNAAAGGIQPPYSLSSTCLVVQIPEFNATGFPKAVTFNGHVYEALDTYVYEIVADQNNAGQFILQMVFFPFQDPNNPPPNWQAPVPQTIISGITGPMPPAGANVAQVPQVFQYIQSGGGGEVGSNLLTAPTAAQIAGGIDGVIVNLQLQDNSAPPVQGQLSTIAFKQEMFMRNNTLATVTADPPVAPPPGGG